MATDPPALTLHMHPLASYCWKVLVALYEAETPFQIVQLDGVPKDIQAFRDIWPIAKMPVLQDGSRVIPETSIIIDYLQAYHPGAVVFIPEDNDAAREVRLWDRFFDLYVHNSMQKFVADRMRPEDGKDRIGLEEARATLDTAYGMLEKRFAEHTWAAGKDFTMADCAAMPALFYAEAVYPFRVSHPALGGYFDRLVSRRSSERVIREAQPWFQYFPFVDALDRRFIGAGRVIVSVGESR